MIPSVDYADFLSVTLPGWRATFPESVASIVVVTSPEDTETQAVAKENGAGLLVTKAWRNAGHRFDKAAALDEAFGFKGNKIARPRQGERCLSIDADVYPFGKITVEKLRRDTIYGCARYACDSMAALADHVAGRSTRESLTLLQQRSRGMMAPPQTTAAGMEDVEWAAKACLGYFQLFSYGGQSFGSWPSAGGYDIAFRKSFPKRKGMLDFYVLHLGPLTRQNWKGRVIPQWATA